MQSTLQSIWHMVKHSINNNYHIFLYAKLFSVSWRMFSNSLLKKGGSEENNSCN